MCQLAASCESKSQSSRSHEAMSDRCQMHSEEQVKYFCSRCQQLACDVCLQLQHRNCDNVSYNTAISREEAQRDELRNTLAELKKLIATLETTQTRAKWYQQQMEESYDQLIKDIIQFRQKIIQHLDKLTFELLLKASKLRGEIIQSHTSHLLLCNILIDEIKEIECDIHKKSNLNHTSQFFIELLSVKKKIQTWESKGRNLRRSVKGSHFVFFRNAKLEEVTTVTMLGTVSVNEPCTTSAKFLKDINIKLTSDKEDCTITGIAALADGKLAVTDYCNKSVKLVDTAACKEIKSVPVTSAPKDITAVNGDQLAVVLKDQFYIQLMSLSPNLSLSHTLPMQDCYRGIAYSEGNFILACRKSASVHICNMSGHLLRKIDIDNTGRQLFDAAFYVAVSPDQSTFYISDTDGNKVVCLNREGVVISTYKNDRLRCPVGVAVDDCGCVLVCGQLGDNIHQLDGEGRLMNVLLGEKDGLICPRAVAHSNSTIYISSISPIPAYCNTIKAFTLGQ